MKKLLALTSVVLLVSCGLTKDEDNHFNIIDKFKMTWNIYEEMVKNDNGSITYYALPWGGLVGAVRERNMGVDWSDYESIRFDFAEPTKVATQIMISDKLKTWGKPGITSLTCNFDGQNVKNVEEVALQASDTTEITVLRVILTPNASHWSSTTIWEGDCHQGNWENGFVIKPEKFTTAYEGDKLEIVFTTDTDDPNITYWLMKTVINDTDQTLEGNDNELNSWGCAMVGKAATRYRIMLTAKDITRLREKGVFINGYHNNVTQCNILKRQSEQEQNSQN
jgi:hypothetical protein